MTVSEFIFVQWMFIFFGFHFLSVPLSQVTCNLDKFSGPIGYLLWDYGSLCGLWGSRYQHGLQLGQWACVEVVGEDMEMRGGVLLGSWWVLRKHWLSVQVSPLKVWAWPLIEEWTWARVVECA